MIDIKSICDKADIVVNGYAFTVEKNCVRVLNCNAPKSACVLNSKGDIIETTMDDIELDIVLEYFNKNKNFLSEGFSA